MPFTTLFRSLSLIAGGALIGWLAQMPSSGGAGQGFAAWRLMFLYASVPAFIGAALIFLVSEPKRRGKPAIKAVTASARAATTERSEEVRVWKECASTCRSLCSP